jgi:hypothetical protein
MSDFNEDLTAIRVHQIASGCLQNVFLIKSTKKFFRNFRVFSKYFFQNSVKKYEVTISAINFDPDSTPIDSNISYLVVSYLPCFYIQRETDYKTTFLANFALTTPLRG